MIISCKDYNTLCIDDATAHVTIYDHMGGFNAERRSSVLDRISPDKKITVDVEYIFDNSIKQNYQNFNFNFNKHLWAKNNFVNNFLGYTTHPELNFKNFVCSFNGSPHVSRKLLTAILYRFHWFNNNYCSKNFFYSTDMLDGHIFDYVNDRINYYRKFFIGKNSEDFFQTINSFGHNRFDHANNIYNLENKLSASFLHIVSETMATSYYPFVTEKFLYSVVTRGLFLAYAQPGWHTHLEKYYGFRPYTKLFDYHFDTIENPVERLIELMSMIAKFSLLSSDDWRDLYEIEKDAIEYNYDHYFSGNYLKSLKNYEY